MPNANDKTAEQFKALTETVEKIRRQRFADLDASVVDEILRIHADPAADEAEVGRAVEAAVEQVLARGK